MSDTTTSRRRQQLLDKYLSGQIDKLTYDALAAELKAVSSSIPTPTVSLREMASGSREVIVETSDSRQNIHGVVPLAIVEAGVELGGFRIERRLGRGGMGEVWQAHDTVGERTVVIKFLHQEFVHHPEEMASVKRVFQLVHNLQHQNICPLYLLGQDQRFGYYIVMKYVDGDVLSVYRRKLIERNRSFSLSDLARVLIPIAKALDYAHHQKIIHCDVKPQNIMVSQNGQLVQLVDFGLAAEIRSSTSRLDSGFVDYGGTHPYMPPEQWRGEVLDAKADQYALAVVAYELLAGHRPFRSSDPSILRECALNDDPSPISGVDATVNSAILRGMAKSKADRFGSCLDFLKHACQSITSMSASDASSFVELDKQNGIRPSNDLTSNRDESNESLFELAEIVSWKDPNQHGQVNDKKRIRSAKRIQSAAHEEFESPIERANRRAAFFVRRMAVLGTMIFIGVGLWMLASTFSTNKPSTSPIELTRTMPEVIDPKPANSRLRYRWQPEQSYVYTVNLDIDRDQDRVVTYSGELTYSVSKPVEAVVPSPKETKGTGTGFVVDPNGYVLTCHHVTEGAIVLEVAIAGKTYPATIVADDADHDLALIHIEASQLPYLPITDSDSVEQGEEVRAFGFPLSNILGENIKATRGIVAGINDDDGRTVFQIDAAVNPGNSGGPLVNERGEVVGVIYAKLIDAVGTRVGFATRINDARSMLKEHNVAFSDGHSKEKLDGPALVKVVSAATALVTVTSTGAKTRNRERVSIGCDGVLHPKFWRRSGQAEEAFDSRFQSLVFSSGGAGKDDDKIETNALGQIFSATSHVHLPNFLGAASQLIVERLPTNQQSNWSYSQPVTFRMKEEADPETMGWGGFGPLRFRRPHPFGGPFGPPRFGGGDGLTTKEYSGELRVDYVVRDRTGDLQTIQKTIDMRTKESGEINPRIQLTGQGTFILNARTGLPQQLEFAAELAENEPNRATKVPMKLTYKLLEERKLPPVPDNTRLIPQPEVKPGKPVDANVTLDAGTKIVGEWAGKWLPVRVITSNEDGTIRIHWEGWSDQWDEDVDRSRLRYPLN